MVKMKVVKCDYSPKQEIINTTKKLITPSKATATSGNGHTPSSKVKKSSALDNSVSSKKKKKIDSTVAPVSSSGGGGKGMSRAAQKRRRKSIGREGADHSNYSNKNDNIDSDSDNSNDSGNNDGDSSDDDDDEAHNDNQTKQKKVKLNTNDSIHVDKVHDDNSIVSIDSKSSILNILNMVEVTEITAPNKAASILSLIIYPSTLDEFYQTYWDSKVLLISNSIATNEINVCDRFKGIHTKKLFEKVLLEHSLYYGVDINIIKADSNVSSASVSNTVCNVDLKHETEVRHKDIMAYFDKGYSIIMLTPQKYDDKIWKLLSCLEVEFDSCTYCKSCLMPINSKVPMQTEESCDIFVLQVEGTCKWCIYTSNVASSNDTSYKMVNETILAPGDAIYIPKGYKFTKQSISDTICLDLHIGTNTNNTMRDFLSILLPAAVESCNHKSINKALPSKFHSYMGISSSEDDDNSNRGAFNKSIRSSIANVIDTSLELLDAAADQHVKQFVIDRLPVPLSDAEEATTSSGQPDAIIYPYTKLRMLRPGIARAVIEDGSIIVYHCMDNAREASATVVNPLEFELDDGPAIEALLCAYPASAIVSDIPHPSEELDDKVSVAQALYKEGFLVIEDDDSNNRVNDDDNDSDDPF